MKKASLQTFLEALRLCRWPVLSKADQDEEDRLMRLKRFSPTQPKRTGGRSGEGVLPAVRHESQGRH